MFINNNVIRNTSDYFRSKSYSPVFKARNTHKFYEIAIVEISKVTSSEGYSQIKIFHISKLGNWPIE